jgi:hypothetical protein
MSTKYKFRDQDQLCFVTFTLINWIDLFIRDGYKVIMLDSLKYCQKNKGFEVYAWCSASDYYGLPGLFNIILIEPMLN